MKVKVYVERTLTTISDTEQEVDIDEYNEWLGGSDPSPAMLAEFIRAHRDYPENLDLSTAQWKTIDVEYVVAVRS